MQTIPSQDQLNRIEDRLQHLTELLEVLLGKIAHKDAKEFYEVPNENFKQALQKARENRKQGKGSPIFTDEEELLNKDPQKYQNIDTMSDWLHKQGV